MIQKFIGFFLIMLASAGVWADGAPPCYHQLERNFFIDGAVMQALSLHQVYQSVWNPILSDLHEAQDQVPRIVAERAARMHPNPLAIPFDHNKSAALLRTVLQEVLKSVLEKYNTPNQYLTNPSDIRQMYEYILSQHPQQLQDCVREIKEEPQEDPKKHLNQKK